MSNPTNYINRHLKKLYSQNGEDGVIEYIFNNIGFTNKIFIEFGFGAYENNSRYLIEKYNFKGLFIDGSSEECVNATKLYDKGINIHTQFITKDNILSIITKYYTGEIDFLSIDVDGIDLYLLDVAIPEINPRVVCIEYCASIGDSLSVTVKYKENFDRHKEHRSGFYCNASLKATCNVMSKKGYVFVGTVHGLNAFFVRKDCITEKIYEISVKDGFEPHYSRTFEIHPRYDGTRRKLSQDSQYNMIKDLDWVVVSDDGIIKNKKLLV